MLTAPVDHATLCTRIPHSGTMCLLEEVSRWDDEQIHCLATSHRDPANPLRSDDRLTAINGVEYAAQAMALHGALLTDGSARLGFLAALRGVELQCARLDNIDHPITVTATRLGGDDNGFIYSFTLHAYGQQLLAGRATVFNQPEENT